MAISEKLTYLNTTKTLIKDNLNLGGANISNEPFRVYSSKLIDIYKDFLAHGTDTLWNNWNKVNGTGESLTLNNTIKGKMDFAYKGNTSQEGTPNPDYPQDIHTVSGDNSIKVGQNIWNYNGTNYEQGFYDGNGGFISRSDYRCFTYDCKQGDLFERTGAGFAGVVTFWNNSTFISSQNFDLVTPKGIVQVPQNANKTKIAGTNASSSSWIRQNPINYQVNLGDKELCKIGDYQDSIVKDNGKWYLNKQIGKVVLDGSENWSLFFSTQGIFTRNISSPAITNTSTPNCLSDNFLGVSRNQIRNNLATADNQCSLNVAELAIAYKSISTVNDFKTWLSTHNTIVYYPLATPTYTEITDTTLINQLEAIKLSYNEQTNISQENNDKPFILDVTALENYEEI
jgi:hypothetical protein